MGLQNGEPLIHEFNAHEHFEVVIDGERKGRGGVPRDYLVQPREMFDAPSAMKLIPRVEWPERIAEQEAKGTRNSDILLAAGIPSMDQDGVGYCWNHSVTAAVQGSRAKAGLPYVPLSAFSIGATIKKGADEGGWGALAAQFARERGIMPQSIWPQLDRNYRKYDTPENWAAAALNKIVEHWTDLTREVYEQNLTIDQIGTACLSNDFQAWDFNWWSHSVMGADVVNLKNEPIRDGAGKLITGPMLLRILAPTDGFGLRPRNSWTDTYGDKGFFVLTGSHAIPDGAIAIRTVTAAAA